MSNQQETKTSVDTTTLTTKVVLITMLIGAFVVGIIISISLITPSFAQVNINFGGEEELTSGKIEVSPCEMPSLGSTISDSIMLGVQILVVIALILTIIFYIVMRRRRKHLSESDTPHNVAVQATLRWKRAMKITFVIFLLAFLGSGTLMMQQLFVGDDDIYYDETSFPFYSDSSIASPYVRVISGGDHLVADFPVHGKNSIYTNAPEVELIVPFFARETFDVKSLINSIQTQTDYREVTFIKFTQDSSPVFGYCTSYMSNLYFKYTLDKSMFDNNQIDVLVSLLGRKPLGFSRTFQDDILVLCKYIAKQHIPYLTSNTTSFGPPSTESLY